MNTVFRLAAAFTAGAAIMYYLDPAAGRRRRALVRDRGVAAGHDVEHFARAKSKRAVDRAYGVVARTRAGLSTAKVGDEQLDARVRTKLGRLVEHPGEVNVDVHEGHVTLRGSASAEEIEEVVDALSSMRGVRDLDNRLSPAVPAQAPQPSVTAPPH